MTHIEDLNIKEEIKINPHLVFNLIVRSYSKQLYTSIRRIVITHQETDDILQETLLKIWKNLSSFKGESKIYTWAYKIAVNESLTFLRSKKRKSWLLFDNTYEHEARDNFEYINGDIIDKKLKEAIFLLPPKQKLVFNMRYYDEIPFKEIAQILKLNEGGIKAQYHHATKKIENYINND